jgi:hypothetical protein
MPYDVSSSNISLLRTTIGKKLAGQVCVVVEKYCLKVS